MDWIEFGRGTLLFAAMVWMTLSKEAHAEGKLRKSTLLLLGSFAICVFSQTL